MSDSSYVYVVGFAPAVDSGNSVGGFEWRTAYSDAVMELAERVEQFGAELDYLLVTVKVPFADPLTDKDAVTEFLDARPELWSTPSQEETGNETDHDH